MVRDVYAADDAAPAVAGNGTVAEFIRRKLLQLTCVFEADCRIEPLDAAPKEIA